MSHSTAPWRWETGGVEECVVVAPDGRCIAWVCAMSEEDCTEQDANAALMAASPTMLAALRDAHGYLVAKAGLFDLSYMDTMLLRIVDAAIQEATEGVPV
jgi:hypothetical protein